MSGAAPFRVLHVCTGNICRSPMAELLMRAALAARYGTGAFGVELAGAGTYPGHAGQPINPPAGTALLRYGVDATAFRARALDRAAIEEADLVIAATREHVHRVVTLAPQARDRTFTLLDLAELAERSPDLPEADPVARLQALRDLARTDLRTPSSASDIDDPYGRSTAVYDRAAAEIRAAVGAVVGGSAGPTRSPDRLVGGD